MTTLNELRKELKKIGFKLKIETLSWGRHATYIHIESGHRISSGGVYGQDMREAIETLKNFKETNRENLLKLKSECPYGLV